MGGFRCQCKSVKKKSPQFENPGSIASCNCGWEIETGYAIASGLAVLEAKRLCLLAIVIFVDWNVLYFAGGLIPLVLTIVSACFGVPASLASVFVIHKRRKRPCFPFLKKLTSCLSCLILFCIIINVIAMASIAVYMKTGRESIAHVFNNSMMLYPQEIHHKVTIDELQLNFQCCGHSKYDDWMTFDWQKVDYASREEMSEQKRISDEESRPMAVPFSCCNLRNIMPCFHMDLSMNRENTVNENGCAEALSHVVLRSSVFTYCVSTFLILTQILLALMLFKIVKKPFPSSCPSVCDCTEKCSSVCPLIESTTSFLSSNSGCTSSSEKKSSRSKKKGARLSTISSRSRGRCTSSSPSPSPPSASTNSKKSSLRNSTSARTRCSAGDCGHASASAGAARIRPSLHTEHRVPKKRSCQKRVSVRPN